MGEHSAICLRGSAPLFWNGRPSGSAWWVLFVDERTGCVSIQSDYGDYAYRWNLAGIGQKSLLEFLTSCDADYLLRKFVPSETEFNAEASRDEVRRRIICCRRGGSLTREEAREQYDAADGIGSEVEFSLYFVDNPDAPADASSCALYERPRQAVQFINEVWPDIRDAIEDRARKDVPRG